MRLAVCWSMFQRRDNTCFFIISMNLNKAPDNHKSNKSKSVALALFLAFAAVLGTVFVFLLLRDTNKSVQQKTTEILDKKKDNKIDVGLDGSDAHDNKIEDVTEVRTDGSKTTFKGGHTVLAGRRVLADVALTADSVNTTVATAMKGENDEATRLVVEDFLAERGISAKTAGLVAENGYSDLQLEKKQETQADGGTSTVYAFSAKVDSATNPWLNKVLVLTDDQDNPRTVCADNEDMLVARSWRLRGELVGKGTQTLFIEDIPDLCFDNDVRLRRVRIKMELGPNGAHHFLEAAVSLTNAAVRLADDTPLSLSAPFVETEEGKVDAELVFRVPLSVFALAATDAAVFGSCELQLRVAPTATRTTEGSVFCGDVVLAAFVSEGVRAPALFADIALSALFREAEAGLVLKTRGTVVLSPKVELADVWVAPTSSGSLLYSGKLFYKTGSRLVPRLHCFAVGLSDTTVVTLEAICRQSTPFPLLTVTRLDLTATKTGDASLFSFSLLAEVRFLDRFVLRLANKNPHAELNTFRLKNEGSVKELFDALFKSFDFYTFFAAEHVFAELTKSSPTLSFAQNTCFVFTFADSVTIGGTTFVSGELVRVFDNDLKTGTTEASLATKTASLKKLAEFFPLLNYASEHPFFVSVLSDVDVSLEGPKKSVQVVGTASLSSLFSYFDFSFLDRQTGRLIVRAGTTSFLVSVESDGKMVLGEHASLKELVFGVSGKKVSTPALFLRAAKLSVALSRVAFVDKPVSGEFDLAANTLTLTLEDDFAFDDKRATGGKVRVFFAEGFALDHFVFSGAVTDNENNMSNTSAFSYRFPELTEADEVAISAGLELCKGTSSLRDVSFGLFEATQLRYSFANKCASGTLLFTLFGTNFRMVTVGQYENNLLILHGSIDLGTEVGTELSTVRFETRISTDEEETPYDLRAAIDLKLRVQDQVLQADFANLEDVTRPLYLKVQNFSLLDGRLEVVDFQFTKDALGWKGTATLLGLRQKVQAAAHFDNQSRAWSFSGSVDGKALGLDSADGSFTLRAEELVSPENTRTFQMFVDAQFAVGDLVVNGTYAYNSLTNKFDANFPKLQFGPWLTVSDLRLRNHNYSATLDFGDCGQGDGDRSFCVRGLAAELTEEGGTLRLTAAADAFTFRLANSLVFEAKTLALDLVLKKLSETDKWQLVENAVSGDGALLLGTRKFVASVQVELGKDSDKNSVVFSATLGTVKLSEMLAGVELFDADKQSQLDHLLAKLDPQDPTVALTVRHFVYTDMTELFVEVEFGHAKLLLFVGPTNRLFYFKQNEDTELSLDTLFAGMAGFSAKGFGLFYATCVTDCARDTTTNAALNGLGLSAKNTLAFRGQLHSASLTAAGVPDVGGAAETAFFAMDGEVNMTDPREDFRFVAVANQVSLVSGLTLQLSLALVKVPGAELSTEVNAALLVGPLHQNPQRVALQFQNNQNDVVFAAKSESDKLVIRNRDGDPVLSFADLAVDVRYDKANQVFATPSLTAVLEYERSNSPRFLTVAFLTESSDTTHTTLFKSMSTSAGAYFITISVRDGDSLSLEQAVAVLAESAAVDTPTVSASEEMKDLAGASIVDITVAVDQSRTSPFVAAQLLFVLVTDGTQIRSSAYLFFLNKTGNKNGYKSFLLVSFAANMSFTDAFNKASTNLRIEKAALFFSFFSNKDDVQELKEFVDALDPSLLAICDVEGGSLVFDYFNAPVFFCASATARKKAEGLLEFSSDLRVFGYLKNRRVYLGFQLANFKSLANTAAYKIEIESAAATVILALDRLAVESVMDIKAKGKLSDASNQQLDSDFVFYVRPAYLLVYAKTEGSLRAGTNFVLKKAELFFHLFRTADSNAEEKAQLLNVVTKDRVSGLDADLRNFLFAFAELDVSALGEDYSGERKKGFVQGLLLMDFDREAPANYLLSVQSENFQLVTSKHMSIAERLLQHIQAARVSASTNRLGRPVTVDGTAFPTGTSLAVENLLLFDKVLVNGNLIRNDENYSLFVTVDPLVFKFWGVEVLSVAAVGTAKPTLTVKRDGTNSSFELNGRFALFRYLSLAGKVFFDQQADPDHWFLTGKLTAFLPMDVSLKFRGESLFVVETIGGSLVADEEDFDVLFRSLADLFRKGSESLQAAIEKGVTFEDLQKVHEEKIAAIVARRKEIYFQIYADEGYDLEVQKQYFDAKGEIEITKQELVQLKEELNKKEQLLPAATTKKDLLQQEVDLLKEKISEANNSLKDLEERKEVLEEQQPDGSLLSSISKWWQSTTNKELWSLYFQLITAKIQFILEVAGYLFLKLIGKPMVLLLQTIVYLIENSEKLIDFKGMTLVLDEKDDSLEKMKFKGQLDFSITTVFNKSYDVELELKKASNIFDFFVAILQMVVKSIITVGSKSLLNLVE